MADQSEVFHDCESEQQYAPVWVDAEDVLKTTEDSSQDTLEATQSEISPLDEYAIDEVHLKELEELMSEDQRQEHHRQSLELKKEGNSHFVESRWEEAAKCYTKALLECPPSFAATRAIFYSNRAACFIKMDQSEQAIADCSKAIDLDPNYAKAYFRRAQLYEMKEDKWDKALEDFDKALKLQPDNIAARAALIRLPPLINERNERMKEDMINKLKDLGNLCLRPFGLSTENFKMVENPAGGYSIQMKK